MSGSSEKTQIEELKTEISKLRSEVDSLHEFVKTLYAMLDEGEEYEGSGLMPAIDFGGVNN